MPVSIGTTENTFANPIRIVVGLSSPHRAVPAGIVESDNGGERRLAGRGTPPCARCGPQVLSPRRTETHRG